MEPKKNLYNCKDYLILVLYLLAFPSLLFGVSEKRGPERGVVTLTFDDGYSCHYDTVLPLLEKYGFSATFYVTTSLLGEENYLTTEQVYLLSQKGHEIASHCVTHRSLNELSKKEINKELSESKATLEKITGSPVTNFAPPYGLLNLHLTDLVKKHYRSNRTIRPGLNVRKNLNPYVICAFVILNTTPLHKLEEWIDRAIAEDKWLILVYHHIDDRENIVTIPAETLESHLKLIQDSGIRTKTMKNVHFSP